MTGVAVATQSLDVHWHDTYFVVAHFHFIMVGGTLTAFLAALHYWFPKIFGRMYYERVGMLAAALVFVGFFVDLLPAVPARQRRHAAPLLQLPRRASSASTCCPPAARGSSPWACSLALVYLLIALCRGPPAGSNPWGSRGFEWLSRRRRPSTTSSPR